MINKIRDTLESLSDEKLKAFNAKLSPSIDINCILGIKMPTLRKLSKTLTNTEKQQFLDSLPHKYLEENILHSIIISEIKDVNKLFTYLDKYLPFLLSWCDCDVIKPIIFKNVHNADIHNKLLEYVYDEREFVCRFGIISLLSYYSKDYFVKNDIDVIKNINSNYYYVNMAISWYFSELLVWHYDAVIPLYENKELSLWIHNKSIQKALESFRISESEKQYLRSLKRIA